TDDRNSPTRLQPDSRLVVYGNAATYKLFKDYGTEDELVVSRHYDTDGNFVSTQVPMGQVLTDNETLANLSYGLPCHTLEDLPDNTRLTMAVYNDHGALVALVTCFTMASAILNESPGYIPQITGI